ncbi:MAG: peptidylprolyl isomerase [Oscillospiraceae bacterium]|nr:peptidylprolyl isomerase [Oscillospiraceae bacterium]
MKKFVIILLVACLALGCALGYFAAKNGAEPSPAPAAETEEPAPAEESADAVTAPAAEETAGDAAAEETPIRTLDLSAIRALHAPDEIVGDVDGREVTWDEYYYWISDMGSQAQNYIYTMAMYGQSLDWDDKLSADSEQTFAEYTLEMAQDCVRQLATLEAVAKEYNVTLTAEDEAALAEQLRSDIDATCGEEASEEDFNAYLEENNLSREMYDRMNRANYLYEGIFRTIYGANGETVTDEDALAYLEENAYLSAAHILFRTVDDSYAALDEATVAEKLAQAEAVSAELRAIEDPEARAKRFAELKEQYCEDPGRVDYPDGYVFVPGMMVEEFENAVKALSDYEVSEPVLSAHGYHVIMRLPLDADATVSLSDDGTPLTARRLFANNRFNEMIGGRIEASVLTLNDDVAALKLADYLE